VTHCILVIRFLYVRRPERKGEFDTAFTAAIRFVIPLLPADLSRAAGIVVDTQMLVFTVGVSLFAGILF
jgi:hypothetical protein